MAGKNSRWLNGNTRYPKIINARPQCVQRCTGRQADELIRAGTPELSKYDPQRGWRNGARIPT